MRESRKRCSKKHRGLYTTLTREFFTTDSAGMHWIEKFPKIGLNVPETFPRPFLEMNVYPIKNIAIHPRILNPGYTCLFF